MATGRSGETLARRYLEARGLVFRAANVRTKLGEIDLVMEDLRARELVFIEVKTRGGAEWGSPEEQVGAKKQRKLRQLAAAYCRRFNWNGNIRIDVVGVEVQPGEEPKISYTPYVG